MSKLYFTISDAVETVADCLINSLDQSTTTIRCAINDVLDSASKNGYRVPDSFNQDRAVARVKRLLNKKEKEHHKH
jgi:hypothetical protein